MVFNRSKAVNILVDDHKDFITLTAISDFELGHTSESEIFKKFPIEKIINELNALNKKYEKLEKFNCKSIFYNDVAPYSNFAIKIEDKHYLLCYSPVNNNYKLKIMMRLEKLDLNNDATK